jgi:hypothetical protein
VSNQEVVLRAALVVIKLTLPDRPIKERQKRNSEKEQKEEEETNEFERKEKARRKKATDRKILRHGGQLILSYPYLIKKYLKEIRNSVQIAIKFILKILLITVNNGEDDS